MCSFNLKIRQNAFVGLAPAGPAVGTYDYVTECHRPQLDLGEYTGKEIQNG